MLPVNFEALILHMSKVAPVAKEKEIVTSKMAVEVNCPEKRPELVHKQENKELKRCVRFADEVKEIPSEYEPLSIEEKRACFYRVSALLVA